MYPSTTAIVYWICPDCEGSQEELLVSNLEMPESLVCLDCGHDSGPMDWENCSFGPDEK